MFFLRELLNKATKLKTKKYVPVKKYKSKFEEEKEEELTRHIIKKGQF